MKVICWFAETREMRVVVETNYPVAGMAPEPTKVSVCLEPGSAPRLLDPAWARQLAETLFAAADVAEHEQGQRE